MSTKTDETHADTQGADELLEQARRDMYTTGRNAAREILLKLAPPRYNVGETFHDWLLGDVVVIHQYPINEPGSQYLVRKADSDPYYHDTYMSSDNMAREVKR